MARRESIEVPPQVGESEFVSRLALVGKEAAFVERLAGELKAGGLGRTQLTSLLENLGARLAKLANPASPWKGIGRRLSRGPTSPAVRQRGGEDD